MINTICKLIYSELKILTNIHEILKIFFLFYFLCKIYQHDVLKIRILSWIKRKRIICMMVAYSILLKCLLLFTLSSLLLAL
jgi:hypothetical protein